MFYKLPYTSLLVLVFNSSKEDATHKVEPLGKEIKEVEKVVIFNGVKLNKEEHSDVFYAAPKEAIYAMKK
ncbi:hypothetical protein [Maribacter sp.]|uniref:hypothetical protein n=1 Tax=Maribacter sp. TaxID=1897614 RepID=UPI0025C15348|nr:hypothetical protein [Maribacter sp.]